MTNATLVRRARKLRKHFGNYTFHGLHAALVLDEGTRASNLRLCAELRQAGVLTAKKGKFGGYTFVRGYREKLKQLASA